MGKQSEANEPLGKTALRSLVMAPLIAGMLIILSHYNLLPEAPDSFTYDWRTALFSPQSERQRNDIAVVLITEDTLRRYYSRSPTDRALLAEIVRGLDAMQPKLIGLDFIFDRPYEPQKTEALLKSLKEANSPIVIGAIDRRARRVREDELQLQTTFLEGAGRPTGHLFYGSNTQRFSLDEDAVRLMAGPGPGGLKSFAETLAEQYLGKRLPPPQSYHIAWMLPKTKSGAQLFPILKIPEHERVDGSGNGGTVIPEAWQTLIKDRIVLVGGDLIDQDQHQTPLTIVDRERVPGVTIHAQILAQFLDGRNVQVMKQWEEAVALICVAAIGVFLGYRFRIRRSDMFVSAVGILGLIGMGVYAFARWQFIIPSTTLFLAWIVGVAVGHFMVRHSETTGGTVQVAGG